MVWSSAASSSASITPAVARTLMRVVSSPCGMGFSLLNAQRLDETQAQMTKLNQLGVLEPVGQGRLDPRSLPPERVHAVSALVGDLRIDGAPVLRIGDAPHQAVALQIIDEAGHRSRGDVEHLRELTHGQPPAWLMVKAHEDLEAALAEAEPVRPALHARVELLSQDADGGQRLRSGLDLSALPLQYLADPRIEQEALGVGLELGGVEFWVGSELTHIYVAHYYIAQETGQAAVCDESVTYDPDLARTATNLDLVAIRGVGVIRCLQPDGTAHGPQVLRVELEFAGAAADLEARRNPGGPAECQVTRPTRDTDNRAAPGARQPQLDLIDATPHLDRRQLEGAQIAVPMGDPAPDLDRPTRRGAEPDVR